MEISGFFSVLVLIVSVLALILALMQYVAFRARERMAQQSRRGGRAGIEATSYFRRYTPR
jgi:hypothetical protein